MTCYGLLGQLAKKQRAGSPYSHESDKARMGGQESRLTSLAHSGKMLELLRLAVEQELSCQEDRTVLFARPHRFLLTLIRPRNGEPLDVSLGRDRT